MGLRRPSPWDDLPLFANDKEIGDALLGPKRASEFHHRATLLEGKNGFPGIDPEWGGRYVPALKAYFDWAYGLAETPPKKPSGAEDPSVWTNQKSPRFRHRA